MNSEMMKKLYAQLKHYGLNAQEWKIRPVSNQIFKLYNLADPEFQLMGQVRKQSWDQIWLISI